MEKAKLLLESSFNKSLSTKEFIKYDESSEANLTLYKNIQYTMAENERFDAAYISEMITGPEAKLNPSPKDDEKKID